MDRDATRWKVAFDVAVASVFTGFCLIVTSEIPPEEGERYNAWGAVTIIAIGIGLALQRRWPYAALGASVGGLIVYTLASFAGGPVYLAPLIPLYTIAQRGNRRATWTAVAVTIGVLLPFALLGEHRGQHLVYFLAFTGWIGGAVFLGSAHFSRRAYLGELEQRARDLEDSREEEARRRVAEERLRIARDLHDVIAHGIATIHMQSGAALHVLDRQPEQAGPALAAIKQLSKETLDELRATVGVLRDGEAAPLAPTPGLDQLEALVDNARRAGVAVRVECDGRPEAVPAAVDLAAYRIVQEALTNVMRHAGPHATVTVTVQHAADEVVVEVDDDGRGAASAAVDPARSRGHGIAGMVERAATVGGHVVAAPRPGGGFRVVARLPITSAVMGSAR